MADNVDSSDNWDLIVKPQTSLFQLNLKEVWRYRDLILLMVKRDITAVYKQTILGPVWMFVQPIFTTLIYTFTFGSANISTDGIPAILFYLMGQTFWTYFADCLNKTSNTFIANAGVFGKVYFPRLVMPVSVIMSNLIKLGIQLLLLICVYIYYCIKVDSIHPQWEYFILLPFFIFVLGIFGLSLGILFSSFTTKYRDFVFLLGFAVQLLMFLSCVVFPATMFKGTTQFIILCNPVASALEAMKFILTGHGIFSVYHILIGLAITSVMFLLSILIFNRTEKSFMDTV